MNKTLLAAAVIAALIIYQAQQGGDPDDLDQTGGMFDLIPTFEDLSNLADDTMNPVPAETQNQNLAAFLWMIRKAEGTATEEGYQALFGWRPGNGKIFTSFADHPRQFFNYTDNAGKTIRTSAAGAYQITATTFNGLVKGYGYSEFSPATQDDMAQTLIKEHGALADVLAGRFDLALSKVRPVWASLPGAGANQPERSMQYARAAYQDAGGVFA